MAPPPIVFLISVIDRDGVNVLTITVNIFILLISSFGITKLLIVISVKSPVHLCPVTTILFPVTPPLVLVILTLVTLVNCLRTAGVII